MASSAGAQFESAMSERQVENDHVGAMFARQFLAVRASPASSMVSFLPSVPRIVARTAESGQ
jgi:hypothetical protein